MDQNQNNQYTSQTSVQIDIKLVLLAISAVTYLIGFIGMLTINTQFTAQRIFNPINLGCMMGALIVFGIFYIIFKKDQKCTVLIPVSHILICASALFSIIALISIQIEAASNYGRYMDMGQFFWSSVAPQMINPIIYLALFTVVTVFYFQGKFKKLLYIVTFGYVLAQAPNDLGTLFSAMVVNTNGAVFAFVGTIGEYLFLATLFMYCYKNPEIYKPAVSRSSAVAPCEPEQELSEAEKKLITLNKALENGFISEEEYEEKKANILSEL